MVSHPRVERSRRPSETITAAKSNPATSHSTVIGAMLIPPCQGKAACAESAQNKHTHRHRAGCAQRRCGLCRRLWLADRHGKAKLNGLNGPRLCEAQARGRCDQYHQYPPRTVAQQNTREGWTNLSLVTGNWSLVIGRQSIDYRRNPSRQPPK